MRRAATLSLAALCSCGIDARSVEVSPACVGAPSDGLVSDFSTARLGRCAGPTCPEALAGHLRALGHDVAGRNQVRARDLPVAQQLQVSLGDATTTDECEFQRAHNNSD